MLVLWDTRGDFYETHELYELYETHEYSCVKLLRVPEFKIRQSITILYDRYFFETFLIMHNNIIEISRNIYNTRKSQHKKYTPRGRNAPIIVGTVKWSKMC